MASKSLTFLQINLRKSKLPSVTVCWNKDDTIFLIKELYVIQNRPSLLAKEGYTLVYIGDCNDQVHAAILVRNSLQAWHVDRLCTGDTSVILIVVNNKLVLVALAYCNRNLKNKCSTL